MASTRLGNIKKLCKRKGIELSFYLSQVENGFKWCYKCSDWKRVDNFGIDLSRYDGKRSKCFDCSRVKVKISTKGRVSKMKGKKITGTTLENMRVASKKAGLKRIGKKKVYTEEGYKNLIKAIRKPRLNNRGENNYQWKGGVSKLRKDRYYSFEYRQWRLLVFERDKYTCLDCDDNKGGNLEAHHIKPYCKYPELSFEIDNGVTLCKTCHDKRHFNPNSTRNKNKTKKGIKLKFENIMKMYHVNPNDHGQSYFVLARSRQQALEFVIDSAEYGSEIFKGKTINSLPNKYSIEEYEDGKVIRQEICYKNS